MTKQKKKRNKKMQLKPIKKNVVQAKCKVCNTPCVMDASETFLKWKAEHNPDYPYDFVFIPQCNCYETVDEWMEIEMK